MKPLPVFALPGTLLDARSLSALLQGLGAHTEILGTSEGLDDEVDRLVALANRVSAGPAVWLGHSLGGIVALHLALRHPAKVAGLVLLGANARGGRESSESRRAAQWAMAQAQGLHALAGSKLAPGYGLAKGLENDDAILASLVDQAETVGLLRFSNQLAYARQRPGLLTPRHLLSVPVLAVSGETDGLCPPLQSEEIITLVQPPDTAQHHCLTGAGHLFPMQQPAHVAQLLHRFLTDLNLMNPMETCP